MTYLVDWTTSVHSGARGFPEQSWARRLVSVELAASLEGPLHPWIGTDPLITEIFHKPWLSPSHTVCGSPSSMHSLSLVSVCCSDVLWSLVIPDFERLLAFWLHVVCFLFFTVCTMLKQSHVLCLSVFNAYALCQCSPLSTDHYVLLPGVFYDRRIFASSTVAPRESFM